MNERRYLLNINNCVHSVSVPRQSTTQRCYTEMIATTATTVAKKLSSVQFNPLNRSDKQHDLQKLFTINV